MKSKNKLKFYQYHEIFQSFEIFEREVKLECFSERKYYDSHG